MADPKTPITRQQLYDLVWSKPATKVGLDYGVTGNAVAKACIKLRIPRPPRGYWAKLAFGKNVARPALSPLEAGQKDSTTLGEYAEKRRQVSVIETPAIVPTPAEVITKTHPAVQKTRVAFRGAEKDRSYGTLMGKVGFQHINVSVTKEQLDRALIILNQLAWHLERNGFDFEEQKDRHGLLQLVYRSTGTKLDFSLREAVERYERELTAEEKARSWVWDKWRYRATGRLKIALGEYHPQGSRKSWSDGKIQKLDDQISEVVEGFVICAQGKHAQELEWAAQRRRWDEEAKARAEAERRRATEERRRAELQSASSNWMAARTLSAFVDACEAQIRTNSPTTEQGEWISWARAVARTIDPLQGNFLSGAIADLAAARTM
jgi:hypothetical protein